jgi:predicted dehydrogenase
MRYPRIPAVTRRTFIQNTVSAAALLTFPTLVPASIFGKKERPAPSNRINLGCIGVGWQGTDNLNAFLGLADCQVVAVSDVDKSHLDNAVNIINKKYGNLDCRGHSDFRDLIARPDVDAVSLGLPDHWHAIPAILAARAGKDIYGEKPLSHTLREGRAMCETVQRYNRVWQTGSWQRSVAHFRQAVELVLNGRVGKLHTVEVGLPAGHTDFGGTQGQENATQPPRELDYDFWLGPAPYSPYCPARVHKNWRWHLDYGGGQLMDWVGHHVDIAHWGMGCDFTGPIEMEGAGEYPETGLWNTATKYRLTARYKNGVTMVIAGGYPEIRGGTKWIGDQGWIWVDRGGIEAQPASILEEKIGPEELNLLRSPGHHRNFLDCVKSRQPTLTPAEVAHRSATPGHLGQIAMLLGRKIRWNPENEQIMEDSTASRLLGNALREPWAL